MQPFCLGGHPDCTAVDIGQSTCREGPKSAPAALVQWTVNLPQKTDDLAHNDADIGPQSFRQWLLECRPILLLFRLPPIAYGCLGLPSCVEQSEEPCELLGVGTVAGRFHTKEEFSRHIFTEIWAPVNFIQIWSGGTPYGRCKKGFAPPHSQNRRRWRGPNARSFREYGLARYSGWKATGF